MITIRARSLIAGLAVLTLCAVPAAAWAGPGVVVGPTAVSGASPFAGCTADDVAGQTAEFGDTNSRTARLSRRSR